MSAPVENMDKASTTKRWSEQNFEIEITSLAKNGWGVQSGYIAAMIPYLQVENFYDYDDQATGKNFSFEHLLKLTKYLNAQGIYEVNINDGIKKFLDVQKTNPQHNSIDDDTNYDRAIQEVLIKILSPNSPIRIVADGNWGRQTQSAYDQVVASYHLQPQSPSRVLLDQLELIAARIVRLRCNDSNLVDVIERNPFCLIDETAGSYELVKEEVDGCIRRTTDTERLILLKGLLSRQNRPALEKFAAFSPWFMLLNLEAKYPPGTFGDSDISLYQNRSRGWAPIGKLLYLQVHNEFIVPPAYYLELSKDETSRQGDILFKSRFAETVDIICCVLKEDFQLLFLSVTQTRSEEGGIEIKLNLREIFNYPATSYPQQEASVLMNANFLKIFVVSKALKESAGQSTGKAVLPPQLYALMRAGDDDLLATLTVGLKFESVLSQKTSSRSFKEIVESLYQDQKIVVPDDLQKRRWGGHSANNGKVLKAAVTSKLPGYYNITITLVIEKNNAEPVNEVAFFLHDSFKDEIMYEPVIKGKAQIKVSAYEAFTVGAYTSDGTMLELDLNDKEGYPKGFYYKKVADDFKQKIIKIYHSKKVMIENDPQKGRWGSKPISKGKVLSAEVTNSIIPGNYKVTIRITSENSTRPLKGDVAFFLHDSFSPPIRYKKVRDGEAKITVTAYEDFTVGAYTEDGTMLELDLHKVKGFPQGFYYVDKNGDDQSTMQSNA